MEHCYNVVWADDDVQSLLEDYNSLFERNGINIIPFESAKPAIDYIRANYNLIDGIIVDAKFSRDGEAVKEEGRSFPGLSMFMQELYSLRNEANMPYPCWIFTGYGDLLRDKYDSDDLSGFEDEIIRKGANFEIIKEWVSSMCEKIALTQSKEFKLRQENSKLFELCTETYLGRSMSQTLLNILDCESKNEQIIFTSFRDVLEEMLDLLVRDGIIDNLTAKTAINERISKLEKAYKDRLPQYVVPSLKLLLVSSPLSHSGTQEKEDVQNGVVPFMYETLLITLKNIVPWFKSFIDTERMIKASKDISGETVTPSSEHQVSDTTPIDSRPSESGVLTVSFWSVRLDNGQYARIDKNKSQRSWKPGTPVKVITTKDDKGKLVVKEIIGIGKK